MVCHNSVGRCTDAPLSSSISTVFLETSFVPSKSHVRDILIQSILRLYLYEFSTRELTPSAVYNIDGTFTRK